jgi:hypothetical protein
MLALRKTCLRAVKSFRVSERAWESPPSVVGL